MQNVNNELNLERVQVQQTLLIVVFAVADTGGCNGFHWNLHPLSTMCIDTLISLLQYII